MYTSSVKCTANTFASFRMVDQKNAFYSNFLFDASHFSRRVTLNQKNLEFLVHQIYLRKEINLLSVIMKEQQQHRTFHPVIDACLHLLLGKFASSVHLFLSMRAKECSARAKTISTFDWKASVCWETWFLFRLCTENCGWLVVEPLTTKVMLGPSFLSLTFYTMQLFIRQTFPILAVFHESDCGTAPLWLLLPSPVI